MHSIWSIFLYQMAIPTIYVFLVQQGVEMLADINTWLASIACIFIELVMVLWSYAQCSLVESGRKPTSWQLTIMQGKGREAQSSLVPLALVGFHFIHCFQLCDCYLTVATIPRWYVVRKCTTHGESAYTYWTQHREYMYRYMFHSKWSWFSPLWKLSSTSANAGCRVSTVEFRELHALCGIYGSYFLHLGQPLSVATC